MAPGPAVDTIYGPPILRGVRLTGDDPILLFWSRSEKVSSVPVNDADNLYVTDCVARAIGATGSRIKIKVDSRIYSAIGVRRPGIRESATRKRGRAAGGRQQRQQDAANSHLYPSCPVTGAGAYRRLAGNSQGNVWFCSIFNHDF